MKGVRIGGHNTSTDDAMDKVIDYRERVEALRREVEALRRDRQDLLSEYSDIRNSRAVSKMTPRESNLISPERIRISFGDVHGMSMDAAAVSAMLADIKRLDPDEVVIGGDLVDCGGWLAKHQPIGFVAACDYSYQEDIEAGNTFLDELRKCAPHATIHYLEGNHEDRVERWVVDQVMASKRDAEFLMHLCSPRTLLRLAEREIKYYRRSEIYGDGLPRGWVKLGKMYFTHSLTYSKNAARDAVLKTAGNVTYFCTHREDTATVVFPGVGLVKAFNPGCLSKMQPIYRHSDPTSWSQGYAVDYITKDDDFQRVHVPIWRGRSLGASIVARSALK